MATDPLDSLSDADLEIMLDRLEALDRDQGRTESEALARRELYLRRRRERLAASSLRVN